MPAPRPDVREILTPWTAGVEPSWSLDKARAALNELEWGTFGLPSMMAEAMGRDDRIEAVLQTLISGFLSLPFALDAAELDEDEPEAKRTAADDIRSQIASQFDDSFPRDELYQLTFWYVMLGVAVARNNWHRGRDEWQPHFTVWHPQFLRWDPGRRVWIIQTRERAERVITPGDGEWILLTRGERGWMRGAIRALVIPWMIRQFAWRDWARYSERHGLPILKGAVPAAAPAPDKKKFRTGLRTLKSATSVTLPKNVDGTGGDFDLELLEAKDRSWESFDKLVSKCDTAIAVLLLGQNLTTEISGGSLAAAQIHDRVRLDRIEFLANDLGENIRDQTIRHWVFFNQGEEAAELAPLPTWDTEPPKDLKEDGEALGTFAAALSAFSAAGFEPTDASFDELQNRFGIQLVEKEVEEAPETPPGAPGEGPDDDPDEDAEPDDEADRGQQSAARARGPIGLQSGDDPTNAPGFIDGQLYADALGDSGVQEGAKLIRADVDRILSVVAAAEGYADLREKLRDAFGEMRADDFAALMRDALTLANLAGRHAVNVDV